MNRRFLSIRPASRVAREFPARRAFLALGVSALVAPTASAHRSQSVLSSIVWNGSRSRLEVTHRIHTDDVEIGLAKYASLGEVIDLTEIANQARLMIYLESHFLISGPAGPIALDPVGVEPLGRELNAYQETLLTEPPTELLIDNRILRDIYPDQTNLVNVRMSNRTRTILFSGRDKAKRAGNLY